LVADGLLAPIFDNMHRASADDANPQLRRSSKLYYCRRPNTEGDAELKADLPSIFSSRSCFNEEDIASGNVVSYIQLHPVGVFSRYKCDVTDISYPKLSSCSNTILGPD